MSAPRKPATPKPAPPTTKDEQYRQAIEDLASTKMTVVTPAPPQSITDPARNPLDLYMRKQPDGSLRVVYVYTSESSKWKHLAARYLTGNGIELATGGDPIVPTSIQFELTPPTYAHYNSNQPLRGPVHWRSDTAIKALPFKDGVLDYVASSHLLEDFAEWMPLLTEWVRVLKQGGRLLVAVPDKKRWAAALAAGQPPNCAHRHESYVGELSSYAPRLGLSVLCDKFTECPVGDYNILFVAEKL